MERRKFINNLSLAGFVPIFGTPLYNPASSVHDITQVDTDRKFWLSTMLKIAKPVLENMSQGKLKETMPVETNHPDPQDRINVTHLEALGRLLAGMAPWLELDDINDDPSETDLQHKYRIWARKSIGNGTDPDSPDYLNFNRGAQPVVDAAFMAHAVLRAPEELWEKLDETTRQNLVSALRSSREITPFYNNWLLFSAMIEVFLLRFAGECDYMRIDYAFRKHFDDWYAGDGIYNDGVEFHFDYYNSYVIQPMLLEICSVIKEFGDQDKYVVRRIADSYQTILERAQRYAVIQERMISPEGTFPAVGRSLPYRFGAFQHLAMMSQTKNLPEKLNEGQVRSALTAVIFRTMEIEGNFDENGWLTVGFCGHQPDIAESYLSTGSMYLCSAVFLPMGLPPTDSFWTSAPEDWTNKKAWSGVNIPADKALAG